MRRGERTQISCMLLGQVRKTKKNQSFKNILEIGAHIKWNSVDFHKMLSTFQVIKRLYGNMLAVNQLCSTFPLCIENGVKRTDAALRQYWKNNDDAEGSIVCEKICPTIWVFSDNNNLSVCGLLFIFALCLPCTLRQPSRSLQARRALSRAHPGGMSILMESLQNTTYRLRHEARPPSERR